MPDAVIEMPQTLVHPRTKVTYTRDAFLGKGGFARVFKVHCDGPNGVEQYACKVIAKAALKKPKHVEKLKQEISIQQSLNHPNIVKLFDSFEDEKYHYIILELCDRRSLMELHKRRKSVTEPEARYFMQQLLDAVGYLHKKLVIHRDLKLGNVFINSEMQIKVGDFGLATTVSHPEQRKKTVCGTPNYIAPEVLRAQGHSFPADIWSIGCILYTLLIGKPPFETSNLTETYDRIKRCDYSIPTHRLSREAEDLVRGMLSHDSLNRPNIRDCAESAFMKLPYPTRLPLSVLAIEPRQALGQYNQNGTGSNEVARDLNDENLNKLAALLERSCSHLESKRVPVNAMSDAIDDGAMPIYWIAKWVDYSDKYGLGYMLNDDSYGVLFNDNTRLLLHTNGTTTQYIDKNGVERFANINQPPNEQRKKTTLLAYFRDYMRENLLKAGASVAISMPEDSMKRLPSLKSWFRTRTAIVLHLSNGTLQINMFSTHRKIVVDPFAESLTILESDKHTCYRLKELCEIGTDSDTYDNLKYARVMADRLIRARSSASSAAQAGHMAYPTRAS